jgi:uncharacterized protein (DUF983 family)
VVETHQENLEREPAVLVMILIRTGVTERDLQERLSLTAKMRMFVAMLVVVEPILVVVAVITTEAVIVIVIGIERQRRTK